MQELLPVHVFAAHLFEIVVPIGALRIAALLNTRNAAEDASAEQFARADDRGQAADLSADLDDGASFLDRVDRAYEVRELDGEGLLAVRVSPCVLRFELRSVVQVARGDHHGVEVLTVSRSR